ncbi:MAG: rod shape-determining protein RodA [Fusobacteria bacterium]|nr:rod shape-determining protein RodA [Fusobacteriota bacterium]
MKNKQSVRLFLKKIKRLDLSLLINVYIILGLSLIFIYSATYQETRSFFVKEIIWIVLGSIVFFIFSIIDYRIFSKYSKIIYMGNILMLVIVHLIGFKAKGSNRWIDLGFLKLQPSEFAKILLLLTLAEVLVNEYKNGIRNWKGILRTGVHIVIPFLLILKQPDLGTALVLIFIYYVLIYLNGVDIILMVIIFLINLLMTPVAFLFLKDYQKKRILIFLDPTKDVLGDGWNVIQSMIAAGSGGLIGKGVLSGTQTRLNFIPESHTDFIFSVLLEEIGLIGGIFLVILYIWLIYTIISIGQRVDDDYGKLLCYGIAAIFFFHSIVNMGMVIGVMPITGLPLLFMSYGGSSCVFGFMMLGIVESVRIYNDNTK